MNLQDDLKNQKQSVFVNKDSSAIGAFTQVHYAVQTCNVGANVGPGEKAESKVRYVDAPKAEIIRKSITSLFESIEYCVKQIPYSHHTVALIDDHSTKEVLDFLQRCVDRFSSDNITVEIHNLETKGLMNSTRYCFEWMDREGQELVYQVQDDMLYMPQAIFEMVDFWNQVRAETKTAQHSILVPWNDTFQHREVYRYKPIARMIVQGKLQCWMQNWDIPSGFFTSAEEFRKHWDKYERYLRLEPYSAMLEPLTLNKILVEERTLSFRPFSSMAFHLQDPIRDVEPYHDWRFYWDRVQDI